MTRNDRAFPFFQVAGEFDRLLNFFDKAAALRGPNFPAVNLWEDGDSIYAEAEVPGLKLEDLEIYVVGNELTLKGRRPAGEGESQVYHRQERGVGEFTRVVTLPVEVNADKVEATLKDGVLTILMPKAEMAKARKITVKTA